MRWDQVSEARAYWWRTNDKEEERQHRSDPYSRFRMRLRVYANGSLVLDVGASTQLFHHLQ